MIWWAYAGLSGAIVSSVVFLAWIVGVPTNGLVQLAVGTATLMMTAGMLAGVAFMALRRRPHMRRQRQLRHSP